MKDELIRFGYSESAINQFIEHYSFLKEHLCFLETLGRVQVLETEMYHLKSTPRWVATVIYDGNQTEFSVTSRGIRLVRL